VATARRLDRPRRPQRDALRPHLQWQLFRRRRFHRRGRLSPRHQENERGRRRAPAGARRGRPFRVSSRRPPSHPPPPPPPPPPTPPPTPRPPPPGGPRAGG